MWEKKSVFTKGKKKFYQHNFGVIAQNAHWKALKHSGGDRGFITFCLSSQTYGLTFVFLYMADILIYEADLQEYAQQEKETLKYMRAPYHVY